MKKGSALGQQDYSVMGMLKRAEERERTDVCAVCGAGFTVCRCRHQLREWRESMTEWNIETALNHHAGCSVYDDGACTCGLRARREQNERSPLAPGEGTWSAFAQKAVAERDAAREEVARLRVEADTMRNRIAVLREALEDVREWAHQEDVLSFEDGDISLADFCDHALKGGK